jgi:PAS domain S-box-containing protein
VWKRGNSFASSVDFSLAWVGVFGALLTLAMAHALMSSLTFSKRAAEEVERQTKSLLEKNQLWRTLSELSPVGILRTDSQGQILYANFAWCKMMQTDLNNLDRDKLRASIHPDDRALVADGWQNLLTHEHPFDIEFRRNMPDGSMRWYRAVASSFSIEEGVPLGAVVVTIDQTVDREKEKYLEAQRLRAIQSAKMATLGEMAGGIAHEINNPLAIISGTIELLKREEWLKNENVAKSIERLDRTTNRIANIVRGLKSFSRNAENDPSEAFDIHDMVMDTVSFCGERFKNHGVHLVVNSSSGHLMTGRSTQLSQVILNLLNNAFDAVVGLQDAVVKLEVLQHEHGVSILVEDNGPGVPEGLEEKIMQPFFTTKEVGKGTGLGLSIAKGIVEDHNGSLSLARDAKLTRFVINLPK